jgi:two-component system cell cycle sensor histidine kinase/response regulator CckA
MRKTCEHGAALVQQLLSVARPCARESRVFGLNDVVSSVEDLLRRLIGENVVLSTSLAADLDAVRMDPAQVQQILLNLVLNARDAMPDGGRITLTTRNCSDGLPLGCECGAEWQLPMVPWVELAVADTGCGMDAETLLRAFEPFFTTKKPGRGNGLGLATARRLAEQEGGIVIAESEPGKGTRVSLRLPRAQSDTPSNSKVKEVIS